MNVFVITHDAFERNKTYMNEKTPENEQKQNKKIAVESA